MIATELERVTAEYLAVEYGSTAPATGMNPIPVTMPWGVFNIHRGEGTSEIQLPAVIVSCDQTTRENDSNNATCALEIMVRVQADEGEDNPDPLARLEELSRVMYEAMLVAGIEDRLNQYRGDRFTCIAVPLQSQGKGARERIIEHTLSSTVYCSNKNLI